MNGWPGGQWHAHISICVYDVFSLINPCMRVFAHTHVGMYQIHARPIPVIDQFRLLLTTIVHPPSIYTHSLTHSNTVEAYCNALYTYGLSRWRPRSGQSCIERVQDTVLHLNRAFWFHFNLNKATIIKRVSTAKCIGSVRKKYCTMYVCGMCLYGYMYQWIDRSRKVLLKKSKSKLSSPRWGNCVSFLFIPLSFRKTNRAEKSESFSAEARKENIINGLFCRSRFDCCKKFLYLSRTTKAASLPRTEFLKSFLAWLSSLVAVFDPIFSSDVVVVVGPVLLEESNNTRKRITFRTATTYV